MNLESNPSLSLFTLNHKKFSQKGFIFCFCSVPFLFHFFLSTFFLFSIITFSLFTFHLHPFVHPFLIVSPVSFRSFLHSLSLSVFLFLFYDRGQHTSPREMSEGGGGNGHQCLKRRSLVGVFLSMTEGLSWWTWINQGECLGWCFLARFGSKSVFLVTEWLVCDTDSPRDMRWWMLIIISLCFFSLHSYSPHVYPPSSTRGKKLLERLGNLRRWSWT